MELTSDPFVYLMNTYRNSVNTGALTESNPYEHKITFCILKWIFYCLKCIDYWYVAETKWHIEGIATTSVNKSQMINEPGLNKYSVSALNEANDELWSITIVNDIMVLIGPFPSLLTCLSVGILTMEPFSTSFKCKI